MSTTTAAAPATYTVAAACRRLLIAPRSFRRYWDGIFTALRDARGRVVLLRDEVEHGAQYAGSRQRVVDAVLKYRREAKGQPV